jgi:hypothetical protein
MLKQIKIAKGFLLIIVISFSINNFILGCATAPTKPTEGAISYHLEKDVEIEKISFYLKVPRDLPYPVCWVDVTIKNLSDSPKNFLVLIQVDDEPGVALRTKKPVEPKKEETLSLITMSKSLPKRYSLTVTH